ncbi:MAG: right-handed parallel beta-helix repeat-containing protein [Planctomycetota bacterium]
MRNCSIRSTCRFVLIGAALFAVGLCGSQVSAATYYVRVSGSDSNNGLAPAAAFNSMSKAAQVVTNGDTVYVGGGTHIGTVTLDGIHQSTAKLSFIADTTGAYTGDAGPVIVSNNYLAVVNCNYVEFTGFTFRNPTIRYVVWKGSYEGLFKDCTFETSTQPLLIKDGSVQFDNCQLTGFTTDAFFVDGEAVLTLLNSRITGCGGDGIEIAKTARVVLNGTTIEQSVGDGIKVARTATYTDDGVVGSSGTVTERLIAGKYRITAGAGMLDGYDSSVGPYGGSNSGLPIDVYGNTLVSATASVPVTGNVFYGPGGSASVPNLTGTISQLSSVITMPAIDVGDAATNNNNATIPLTSQGRNSYSGGNLTVSYSGDILDLPPGKYYFGQVTISGGALLRISGPTTIYVTNRVTLSGGSVANPSQKPSDLTLLVTGTLVSLTGSASLHAAIYAPNATVETSGSASIYGMVVANEVIANGSGGIHMDKALAGYAATVQGLSAVPSSPAPPVGWTAITEGTVDLTNSTLQTNRRAINVETAQSVAARTSRFLNNTDWGLCLNGPFDLDTNTISGNTVGGLWLKAAANGSFTLKKQTIANNPQYGIYLDNCTATLDATNLDNLTFTTSSDYIVAAQGGAVTLNGVTLKNGLTAAVFACGGTTLTVSGANITNSKYGILVDHSTATVTNTTLSANEIGLYAVQAPTLSVTGTTTLSNNTAWGAKVDLTSSTGTTTTFSGATVSGNANGISIIGASNATVTLPNTSIFNNTTDGLRFDNSTLSLSAAATSGLQITNAMYGIDSVNSTLTLDSVSLSGHSVAAVYASGGNLTVNTSTLSGSNYGISANGCGNATIDTCTLSGNAAGLYASQNTNLLVNNSTFTGNTQWGATVTPKTGAGLSAIFSGCTIYSNVGGITLVNAANGQVSLRSGTVIRDNTNSGLHFATSNVTVNDQAGGTAWQTLRNGYGISAAGSTLTLAGLNIEQSVLYGVYCQDSTVSLTSSTVSGNGGVYADAANHSLTVASTTFNALASAGWGVARYGGNLDISNCVLNGFAGGVYLATSFSGDQAAVNNCTLVNLTSNGVYLASGDATVRNTILVGGSGAQGLTQASGQLTHSNNLLDGFGTPFSGTAVDASELLTNPRFVDAASGDFRLAKGSPAINAGADLTVNGITIDILGNARPTHTVFEIGAYEYTQDAGSLRILSWKETR